MRIRSKFGLTLLAMIMGSPAMFAQGPPGGPGPDQPAAPGGPPAAHRTWQGRMGHGGLQGQFGQFGAVRGHRWERQDFMLARLVRNSSFREKLGITAEQADKIRQQTFDFRKGQIRNRADLQVKRLELGDLLAAENPDRAAIDKKLEEISAVQLAQRKAAVDYRLTMHGALTPEQRQKLQQLKEQFFYRGPGRHGPPRPGPAKGSAPANPQSD
jgi:Spy/CpxP family protein refolding chaperone